MNDILPYGDIEPGERVTVAYESARTGNPQEVTAEVKSVLSAGAGPGHYTLQLKDHTRNRTIHAYTHFGDVETRERRGHMVTLGDLLSITAADD